MISLPLLLVLASTPPCPGLRGDALQHQQNLERREEAIVLVEPDNDGLVIVYAATELGRPTPTRLAGLELVETDDERAVARVDDALTVDCERMPLEIDDSLGQGLQVVYVDDDGMLLLAGEELLWWGIDDEESPEFTMVWRSRFTVEVNQPTAKKRKKRKTKRRKKRKRRR